MLRSLTARQFLELRHYAELEPFDETRMDMRFASVVKALWDINRDTKRHPQPFPIEDFVLLFGDAKPPKKKPKSWQSLKATAQMIALAFTEAENK